MGVMADDYPVFLKSLFRLSNIHGALVTMPHKVTTVALLDAVSVAVKIAGSCNAILRRPDGSLLGDMFDGVGFTRGAMRKGFDFAGVDCLIVGAGGVGSAIAAAIAAEGARLIALHDPRRGVAEGLAVRLRQHYPSLGVELRSNDPAAYHLVVNATPLGMTAGDPLPVAVERLDAGAVAVDLVTKPAVTPFLAEARRRGSPILTGEDMFAPQAGILADFLLFSPDRGAR
jgi:shikimate dehydrogenase